MNLLKKAVLGAAITAACSGAMAATVTGTTTYTTDVYQGMSNVNLFTAWESGLNPRHFELRVTDNDDTLTFFKLIDTTDEQVKVDYALYEDTNGATQAYTYDTAAALVSTTITDAVGNASGGMFQWLLAAGKQYVLRIETQTPYSSHTQVSAVPLPAAAWLFGSVALGLLGFSRRQKKVDVSAA